MFRRFFPIFLAIPLLLALSFSTARADYGPGLTGEQISLADATAEADVVFAGKVKFIGPPVIKALGELKFFGVQIQVTHLFKGTANDTVTVDLIARNHSESPPLAQENYIFRGKKRKLGADFEIMKIVLEEPKTFTLVERQVSDSPR